MRSDAIGVCPELSIVIPAYNASKSIIKTLASLEEQTVSHDRYEIIVVDDGSGDDTLAVCREFAAQYTNLTVVHQENGGVSSARNLGIENACGKWICFVDSDDFVDRSYVEAMISSAQTDDLVVFFHYLDRLGNLCPDKEWMRFAEASHREPSQVLEWICDNRLNPPWDKRYTMKILQDHNVRFPVGIGIAEDFLFNFEYALHASSVYVDSRALYVYTDNFQGACRTRAALKSLGDFEAVFQRFHQICRERKLPSRYVSIFHLAFLRNIARCAGQLSASGMPAKEIAKRFHDSEMVQTVLREPTRSYKNIVRKALIKLRLYRLCHILLRQK